MSVVPTYAELVSFGTFNFPAKTTYLDADAFKLNAKYVSSLGSPHLDDYHAGGVAPYDSAEWTWVWYITAPDEIINPANRDAQVYIENLRSALLTLAGSTNTDGTSGQRQTLTVLLADDVTTVSAPARLVDLSQRSGDRNPYLLKQNVVFAVYGDFA